MQNLLENINVLKLNEIAGIEVSILSDSRYIYNLVVLKKNKSRLEFDTVKISLESFDEIKQYVPLKTPVCLVINGKGIIHRKIPIDNNNDEVSLLQKNLPNASINDFYIQKHNSSGSSAFISIARKNIVDDILKMFSENNFHIVDSFIGPFENIESIISLLNSSHEEFIFGQYKFNIINSSITDFALTEKENDFIRYQVGDEWLSNKAIIAFGAGFQYLFVNSAITNTTIPLVKESSENFRYSRLFRITGWAVLIFFFSILLINFLIFDYYNKKYNQLSSEVGQYEGLLNKHEVLKNELEIKKQFLEETGLLHSSKNSYYADRLAAIIPSELSLTELSINPLQKKKQNKDQDLNFRKNIISISGTSKKSTILNDWINKIEKYEWVKDVTIMNYSQNNRNIPALFTIEIKIKE